MNPPTFLASFVLTILHSVDFHFLKKCMKLTFCLVFKTFSSESLISKKQVLVSHHGDVASRKAMLILNKLFYFANSVNMVLDFLKKRKKKMKHFFQITQASQPILRDTKHTIAAGGSASVTTASASSHLWCITCYGIIHCKAYIHIFWLPYKRKACH